MTASSTRMPWSHVRGPARANLGGIEKWSLVAGGLGILANALLAGLWLVAIPGNHGYDWTGPANDIVGAAATLATVPVVLSATRAFECPRHVQVLAYVVGGASGVLAVASGLLVTGIIPFAVQLVVALPYIGVLFGWMWAAGRSLRGMRGPQHRLVRTAELLGACGVVGLALAGLAALLPERSLPQYVVGGVAGVVGLTAYLGEPLWLLAVSRRLQRCRTA